MKTRQQAAYDAGATVGGTDIQQDHRAGHNVYGNRPTTERAVADLRTSYPHDDPSRADVTDWKRGYEDAQARFYGHQLPHGRPAGEGSI